MLPGKQYTPESLLYAVRRRFWFLIVPLAIAAAVTATVVRRMPNLYGAETVILVIPQKVPESYVRSTVTETLQDRLQSIKPTILSRTRLEQIILDFNLYPDERQTQPMEDVVLLMRRNVLVDTKGGDSFSISFTGPSPVQVMNVTNRLASLFIDESLRDRRSQAYGTDRFMESQLVEAKAKLVETEKRLEDYRRVHAGELPSQLGSNLQQAEAAQRRVSDTRESINRDRDRRLLLEQQLAELRQGPRDSASPSSNPQPQTLGTDQELVQAVAQVAALEARGLRSGHPDLEQARRRVRDLQARVAAGSGERAGMPTMAEIERRRRMGDLEAQIAEMDRQILRQQDEERKLLATADEAQRRADALPTRESELTELMRDYGTLQSSYNGLLAKKQESEIAANLEERQIGEQFRLLDLARLPERPLSPNRVRLNAMGAVVGLGLGVLFAGFLEFRDRSFKTDAELSGFTGVPVLAVIPLMQSDRERRSAVWKRLLLHGSLGAVVAGCVAIFLLAIR